MKIIRLELVNFRCFYGKHSLEFSTDPDKNITLIHAENGVGKTTLLNAFLWCFYKKTSANFKRPKILLNNKASDEGITEYSVSVMYEESGSEYLISRRVKKGAEHLSLYSIDETGNFKPLNEPASHFNTVIPKEMADYFFFHAEGVNSISQASSGKTKDAIHDILGFKLAEKAIESLKKVRSEYRRDLAQLDTSDDSKEVAREIESIEAEIETEEGNLKRSQNDLSECEDMLRSLSKKLLNSNSEKIREIEQARLEITGSIKQLKQTQKEERARRVGLISKYASSAFSKILINKGIDFIDEKQYRGTIPAPYNEQLLQDILNEAQCICGTEVSPDSPAFLKISKLLGKASDPELANRISRARGQISVVRNNLEDAYGNFQGIIKNLDRIDKDLGTAKRRLIELTNELDDLGDTNDIKETERQKILYAEYEREHLKTIGAAEMRLAQLTEELAEKDLASRKLQTSDQRVKIYREKVQFIEKIEQRIRKLIDESENSARSHLLALINDFLKKYFRHDYHARMNESFDIQLCDKAGRPAAESDGQGLLLSLSFISALIRLSRDRSNSNGHILTPGVVAPFFIDAPFGDLDLDYKRNIARELPSSVDQAVLFLSSTAWTGVVDDAIKDKVGKEYNLVAEIEGDQGEKRQSQLEIRGQLYDTARYGQEFDRTNIEEVL